MSAETAENLRVAEKRFAGGHITQKALDAAKEAHAADEAKPAGAAPARKPRPSRARKVES